MTQYITMVSVIIPVYHDWEKLERCLDALAKQDCPSISREIIVVNNDPRDCSGENLCLPDHAILINEEKPGSYAARNAALQVAQGDVIAFTDSDCIPWPDWLKNGVHYLNGGADRVAGRIDLLFSSSDLSWAEMYEKAFAFRQKKNAEKGVSVTANMFVWKSVIDEVGYFEEGLMSGGDIEWNRRACEKGKTIVFGEQCVVYHPARRTVNELIGKRKRVTGGVHGIDGFDARSLMRALLPPVNVIPELLDNKALQAGEKVVAFLVRYFLKVVKYYYFIRLELKMDRPGRT